MYIYLSKNNLQHYFICQIKCWNDENDFYVSAPWSWFDWTRDTGIASRIIYLCNVNCCQSFKIIQSWLFLQKYKSNKHNNSIYKLSSYIQLYFTRLAWIIIIDLLIITTSAADRSNKVLLQKVELLPAAALIILKIVAAEKRIYEVMKTVWTMTKLWGLLSLWLVSSYWISNFQPKIL